MLRALWYAEPFRLLDQWMIHIDEEMTEAGRFGYPTTTENVEDRRWWSWQDYQQHSNNNRRPHIVKKQTMPQPRKREENPSDAVKTEEGIQCLKITVSETGKIDTFAADTRLGGEKGKRCRPPKAPNPV